MRFAHSLHTIVSFVWAPACKPYRFRVFLATNISHTLVYPGSRVFADGRGPVLPELDDVQVPPATDVGHVSGDMKIACAGEGRPRQAPEHLHPGARPKP